MIINSLGLWWQWLPNYLSGMKITLALTASALTFGMFFGLLFAIGLLAQSKLFRLLLTCIIELGRGTPALVTLYVIYFGLPQINIIMSSFVAACLAMAYTTAAYTAVIFNAGIRAVPIGQWQSADALGLSRTKTLSYIIIPQAVKIVMPTLITWSIVIYQGTSLAFTISVPELMSKAYNTGFMTLQFGTALLLGGILYSVVSLSIHALVRRTERQSKRDLDIHIKIRI